MCTVTFIPLKNNRFVLTSNRDESPQRSPETISSLRKEGQEIIFPKDKGAGGSWIAASSQDRLVCLLNGAFDCHQRTPPYRKSRGQMVLDFFGAFCTERYIAVSLYLGQSRDGNIYL